MRNFFSVVVSYVIAAAVVLSYVFIACASVAGIIFSVQVIIEMYKDLRNKWAERMKRRANVRTIRRSDEAGEKFA